MSWDGVERRKVNRMKSSFEPQTVFEAYVKVTLDNIAKQFDKLPCDEAFKRLGKGETDISNIKGKATVIGTVAGFVAALITKYIAGK